MQSYLRRWLRWQYPIMVKICTKVPKPSVLEIVLENSEFITFHGSWYKNYARVYTIVNKSMYFQMLWNRMDLYCHNARSSNKYGRYIGKILVKIPILACMFDKLRFNTKTMIISLTNCQIPSNI